MRIIQLIDSLEAGGAERMAVNYANALADEIDFSGLVVTRKEGSLVNELSEKVDYLFLNRKKTLDFKAIFRLKKFVKENKIQLVHAHSSSFFMAFLLKLVYPKINLIWHDHYGKSEFLEKRNSFFLQMILPFFRGAIVVNLKLKIWAEEKLKCKNVIYLPNFPSETNRIRSYTFLNGIAGKRIVCLANLREQKNHFLLLNVAEKIKESHPDWTFHLVGKDFEDDYSRLIKDKIAELDLNNTVFCYGSRQDTNNILGQSEIGVLSSDSEGLPLSLLEYGLNKMAVVMTKVGEIPSIIKHRKNGFIVPSLNEELFYNSLVELIEKKQLRDNFGEMLYQKISEEFSQKTVIQKYLNWLQKK